MQSHILKELGSLLIPLKTKLLNLLACGFTRLFA